ncbi:MAG TPA: hypothetical protein VH062_06520 [Polyangiaceae bacterium]|jgi:hypothetical protein|nr:hypothetical protein [Polyangiaceae bacterium]
MAALPNPSARIEPSGKGSVRGAGIIEWLRWQSDRFGDEAAVAALRHVPAELSACFDPTKPFLGVDPQKWYPAESFHAFLDIVVQPLSPDVLQAYVDDAARRTMQGLMRRAVSSFASALSSVERYARVTNALFRLMHDTGRVQIVTRGLRQHEATISDWRGHHPVVCRFTIMCQAPIYERMGCTDLVIRHACVATGALTCGCVTTW